MLLEKLPPSLRVVNDNREDINLLDFGNSPADITRLFNIFNDGSEPLEWELTETCEWITGMSKSSGTLNPGGLQSVIITIDREKLSEGKNTTPIHVTSDNGSKTLTVVATHGVDNTSEYVTLPAAGIAVQKTDVSNSSITWTSAKNLCESSIAGGYTDWRLPLIGELGTLYANKETIGGFKNEYYWSSTVVNYTSYYTLDMQTGSQSSSANNNIRYARCVRTLP